MIKIKTSEVNDFLKRSRSIKQNGLLPILECVLLKVFEDNKAIFFDTNLNIWCKHETTVEAKKEETFLLDRKLLGALASSTKSEYIYIKQQKSDIILLDGEGKKDTKLVFKIPDGESYPKFPDSEDAEKKTSTLTPEFMQYLNYAKQFINTLTEDFLSFVHVFRDKDKNMMVATDRSTMFVREFDTPVSDILISADCAGILCQYETCIHWSHENYDFYDFGSTTYGFIKSEQQRPPFDMVLKNFSEEKKFMISRSLLAEYNSVCLKISPLTFTLFHMEKDSLDDDAIRFVYNLSQYGILHEKTIGVESNFDIEKFTFNGNQIERILKTVQKEKIIFYCVGMSYFIRDEGDDKMTLLVQGYGDAQVEALTSATQETKKTA